MAVTLLGGKCKKCGCDDIVVLEFHHHGDDKEFNINELRERRWSIIKREVEKCILVCRNCHSEIHYEEIVGDERRRKLKLCLLRYRGGMTCMECGYHNENTAALDFHHPSQSTKNFVIQEEIGRKKSITTRILNEVERCDVLCRNCHARKQIDIEKLKKIWPLVIEKTKTYRELQKPINIAEIRTLLNAGKRQSEIASILNCSKSAICGLVKKHKLFKPSCSSV